MDSLREFSNSRQNLDENCWIRGENLHILVSPTIWDARTKYFKYFGRSRIVADTALEGGSPECVENLTKRGLVKAGAESL